MGGAKMKHSFILFFSIILILSSFSAVNADELSNMTDDNVLSLDVSQEKSGELLREDEESALIQNNTISDFNSEYDINSTDLPSYSISNVQYGTLKSNGGSTTGNIDLIKTNTYTPIYYNPTIVNPTQLKYDLRDGGYVSPVKDQGNGKNCWAYATLSALESCILKANGVEYDFSESMLTSIFKDNLKSNTGGGSMFTAMGYIAGWLGAVKENYGNTPTNIINVQNIYVIKKSTNTYDNKNDIKKAILNYGSVVAGYYQDKAGAYFNNKNGLNYYNYNSNIGLDKYEGHAITIVGWDDTYSKNNFKITPKGNGAWICKNSWGADWGNNGYYYISYYDATLAKIDESFTFILNDSTKYYKNYQYDIQATNTFKESYNAYRNIFTSEGNEKLVAISSYFTKGTHTIIIKINDNPVCTQTFTSNIDGYFTVKLKNQIQLTYGQKFEVIIKNSYNDFHICEGSKITKKLPTGVSYVSKDGGNSWIDAVNKHNAVCCIKAFTTTNNNLKNRPTIIANDLSKYYGGSQKLEVRLTNAVNNNLVITTNNRVYSRNVVNGVMSMAINLPSGNYPTTIQYSDSNFVLKVTILITIKPTIVGSDITKYYKNGTQYYATFYDTNGNLLKNTAVTFNINGVFYTRTTNDKGVAKLNINLEPENYNSGTYIITAKNPTNNEQRSNKITVLSILEAKDLTKKFSEPKAFTVKLLDGTGKPCAGKTITFNINGVFYYRVTNSNGVASLNINLPQGTYIATASYNGQNIARKVVVTAG